MRQSPWLFSLFHFGFPSLLLVQVLCGSACRHLQARPVLSNLAAATCDGVPQGEVISVVNVYSLYSCALKISALDGAAACDGVPQGEFTLLDTAPGLFAFCLCCPLLRQLHVTDAPG